ncbi:hypothetical protein CkaCkLH20_03854 [Colletotrichum karsti]|uniref:2EXR domain-containing protein n=1 Tax=Colletotrichum karsti TaxID=1095194 RepID=A0A9P6LK30_9PEZI|nr:uncharacterized protein CkaCkLH20_03854 [Colletotrichum karsti]KAF9878954.1 hypothetical protein CkaCkLH20_03854 [Colletotrichum karsti]
MTPTFPLFPLLPPEIRLEIWKAASRDLRPGVHFFSVCPGSTDTPIIMPPVFDDGLQRPWTHGNPSTIGFGNWTACSESRAAVREKMQPAVGNRCLGAQSMVVNDKDISFDIILDEDLRVFQTPPNHWVYLKLADSRFRCAPYHSAVFRERVGFEYHSSWAFNPAEENIDEMVDEPGPRGFFLGLLRESMS